jgi:D-glutamate cyclase
MTLTAAERHSDEPRGSFESIDRLTCLELRSEGLPTGVVPQLYALVRGARPLCLEAAEALADGSIHRIAFLTGIVHDKQPHGELDGPIGCAVLAASLALIGRDSTVFAPRPVLPVIEAVRAVLAGRFAIRIDSEARAASWDAAVSVERLGRNRKGAYHSVFGLPRSEEPFADDFIEALNAAGRLTVGIGDAGNEIGFGKVFDKARKVVPRGQSCGCHCGDGIVTCTPTRILLPASVSNFGAYGVAAALACISGRIDMIPSADLITNAMSAAVEAGGIDGGSMIPGRVADDGIPAEAVRAVITLLRTIVEMR